MGLQSFLAVKFLAGKNRSWLFSSLTLMALAGVFLSVTAFVVVQAVMSGFNEDLEKKILGFSAHLTVLLEKQGNALPPWATELSKEKGVVDLQHFVEGEAVLSTRDGDMVGVRVRGPDSKHRPQGETIKVLFEEGEGWESFYAEGQEVPGILLGAELAESMGIVPILTEGVELLFPVGEVGPTGELEPNVRVFRIVGTFRSGYYDYDSKYVLVPMKEADWLFGDQGEEHLAVFLQKPSRANQWKKRLQGKPGVAEVSIWQEQHTRLFSALKLERMGMIFVLVLMLLLASFNILSLLMMVVFERRKEIAVLRALGLPLKGISRIFHRAGIWIGMAGGLLGVLAGAGISLWLNRAQLRLPSTYYLEALPVKLNWGILIGALGVAILLSWLATYFPGREGRSLSVTEALRYE